MSEQSVPSVPKPAACLMLIRDGAVRSNGRRLEVLLTERNGAMAVAAGAFVFPGGKVEPEDGEGETAFVNAAIREAFEEAGVILAPNVDLEAQERVMVRYKSLKHPIFHEVLAAEGISGSLELLPFAHWITPKVRAHRFDTRFYLAAMPESQDVRGDGIEAVSSLWVAPDEMIMSHGHDMNLLMFPTRMSLGVLASARDVAEAVEIVRARAVVPIMPELEKQEDGIYARVPAEAGFGGSLFRFQMKEKLGGLSMIEPVQ